MEKKIKKKKEKRERGEEKWGKREEIVLHILNLHSFNMWIADCEFWIWVKKNHNQIERIKKHIPTSTY